MNDAPDGTLANLPVADKPKAWTVHSFPMAITFFNLSRPIARRGSPLANNEGEIVSEDGVRFGRHSGAQFSDRTAQRLGFAAVRRSTCGHDRENNRVVVGMTSSLPPQRVKLQTALISSRFPNESLRASVKIRHKHVPAEATIHCFGCYGGSYVFEYPQAGHYSGQARYFTT